MRKLCAVALTVAAVLLVFPGEQAGAVDTSQSTYDFNADGRSDHAVVRSMPGGDYAWYDTSRVDPVLWGTNVFFDFPVPADYDGDGKMDAAVTRQGANPGDPIVWYINGTTAGFASVPFGDASLGDIALHGDINGDGRADLIIYRPGDPASSWHVAFSSGGYATFTFGNAALNDSPSVGDFNGDGKADLVIRRPGAANVVDWFFAYSNGAYGNATFGEVTDLYVPGDFSGDNAADLTAVRTNPDGTYQWYVYSLTAGYANANFGDSSTDFPVMGDYDGDGTSDIGVARYPATLGAPLEWYTWNSSNGAVQTLLYGENRGDGDVPTSFFDVIAVQLAPVGPFVTTASSPGGAGGAAAAITRLRMK